MVLGAGAVGILTMLTLKSAGVRDVVMVDLVENRLDLARSFGAIPVDGSSSPDLGNDIRLALGGDPDLVMETAGNQLSMDQAIHICKRGGQLVFVGYTKDGRADLKINLLIDKQLSIKTVFRYRNIYPRAIAAVASGAIPARGIVSAVYPFLQSQTGFEQAIYNKGSVTKCVIEVEAQE